MKPDWCRVEISADTVPYVVAVLGAALELARMQLRRENLPVDPVVLVGPDDLEGVTAFMGYPVVRVEHWPGRPCLMVPCGPTVPHAYEMARRLQRAGFDGDRLHLFGPPGVQYQALALMWKPQGEPLRARQVHGVPVDQMQDGLMIGVELT